MLYGESGVEVADRLTADSETILGHRLAATDSALHKCCQKECTLLKLNFRIQL